MLRLPVANRLSNRNAMPHPPTYQRHGDPPVFTTDWQPCARQHVMDMRSVGGRLRVWIRWEKKLPEAVSISSSVHMTSGELTNER